MISNYHVPIFTEEINSFLNLKEAHLNSIYVDATLGDGGHTYEIALHLKDKGNVIAIDKDIEAINRACMRLKDFKNIIYIHNNYEELEKILISQGINKIDGILFDLGVSSFQLDLSGRGFSFIRDEPLDMRMNSTSRITACEIVNSFTSDELARILWQFGEERWSRKIAEWIVKERIKKSIDTTAQLVEIIKKAVPYKYHPQHHHVATKTFQALRIAVNQELVHLKDTLVKAIKLLNTGGRIAVISFHSLEDRIVKTTFRQLSGQCSCPPHLPVCQCNIFKIVKILTLKALSPADKEIEQNKRARSAHLRIAEKVEVNK